MALGFSPSYQRGVIVMTDYEMLSLVVAIIMLVLAAMSFYGSIIKVGVRNKKADKASPIR